MIGLDDIRRLATALPEVEEATRLLNEGGRLPTFKVRGRAFVGPERDGTHAVVAIALEEARHAVTEDPDAYEEVWRTGNGRIFVGLRVDLHRAPADRFAELVRHAWRNKAPKRLVADYDRD